MRRCCIVIGLILTAGVAACAVHQPVRSTLGRPITPDELRELWVDRGDIASLDLFWGASPTDLEPKPGETFRYRKEKTSGFSHTYDVVDSQGRKWGAKLGLEAQTEVVASRIFWAVGYHQPPTYFVPEWKLEGSLNDGVQNSARFRPDLKGVKVIGNWSLFDNPFVGTQAYRGLLVLNAILNNWDLKDDQNKVYRLDRPRDGATRWFLIRDLGAAFGKPRWPAGSRNDVGDFEQYPFIVKVEGDRVELGKMGRENDLFRQITRRDVRWMALRLAQITDTQWDRAFGAGGYAGPVIGRYVRRIKQKINDGLALCPNGC